MADGDQQRIPHDLEEWVQDLRTRTHTFSRQLGVIEVKLNENAKRVDELDRKVSEQMTKDQIADAVADKLHERRRYWWNAYTKAAAGLVVAFNLAGAVKVIVG